jgi:MSHA pilin protein MshD
MSIETSPMTPLSRGMASHAGLSLIELLMFIVIVSVGVAGIVTVFNVTTQKSADPQIRRQMLAIAESLLEEVELKPFTYCDPDDVNAATATRAVVGVGPTFCNSSAQSNNLTQPVGETRVNATNAFDNVADYGGTTGTTTINPIVDIAGNPIGGLTGYSAQVSIAAQAFGGIAAADADGAPQCLLITVTVTNGGTSLSLSGYRLRYAPRSLP